MVIFGATGDLAKKKLFPALYQLMLLDLLPRHVNIVGYGRRAVMPWAAAPVCVKLVLLLKQYGGGGTESLSVRA